MRAPLSRCLLAIALLGVSLRAQPVQPTIEERQARSTQAAELRKAHAASEKYNPYDTGNRDIRKAAFACLDKKNFTDAIAIAEKGLERFPCDIDLHLALAVAWRDAGDKTKADQFRAQYLGLVDSIMDSGTGRDYASAFHVINVDEEYSVIRVLRLKVVRQTLQYHEGHAYDVMTVKGAETDPEFPLYFNIDLPNRWLRNQFAGPEKK